MISVMVAPCAGAWVEITQVKHGTTHAKQLLPAWVEMGNMSYQDLLRRVAPFAGVWIEIIQRQCGAINRNVS